MVASRDSLDRLGARRLGAALLPWATALSTACASQQLPLENGNGAVELTRPAFAARVVQTPSEQSESPVHATPTRREDDQRDAAPADGESAPSNSSAEESTRERARSFPRQGPTAPTSKTHVERKGVSGLTIAGYCVQVVGLGGLITGAVLGADQHSETRAVSGGFAIGGAVALVAGTIMAANGPPLTYGSALPGFIEQR